MCAINSSYYWLKANVNIEHNSHKIMENIHLP